MARCHWTCVHVPLIFLNEGVDPQRAVALYSRKCTWHDRRAQTFQSENWTIDIASKDLAPGASFWQCKLQNRWKLNLFLLSSQQTLWKRSLGSFSFSLQGLSSDWLRFLCYGCLFWLYGWQQDGEALDSQFIRDAQCVSPHILIKCAEWLATQQSVFYSQFHMHRSLENFRSAGSS